MVSAEERSKKLYIRFKGTKRQFNEYINKVMALPDKEWDITEKCWTIPISKKPFLENAFKNVEYLEEVNNDTKVTTVTDYDDMGKNMKLTPYDYQKEAIKFALDNKNILIVYPCGSGKTPIGIGTYLEAKEQGIITGPGMIVVKASLKTQWKKEIGKFSDLKATIIQSPAEAKASINDKIKRRKLTLRRGTLRGKKLTQADRDAINEEIVQLSVEAINTFQEQFDGYDLYVLNYEALRDDEVRKELHRRHVQFVFADEIHYVKNKSSKRSKALYEFGEAKMTIGATATPVGKNPEDLFGLFKFINPSIFPKWANFAKLYIKYAGYGRISGFRNLDHLRKKIAPHLIVKTKDEVSEYLPSLNVFQRYCDLAPEQLEMTERIFMELEELHEKEYQIRKTLKSEAEAKSHPELAKIEGQTMALQTFAQEIADSVRLLSDSESEMAKNYVCGGPNNKLELLAELVEEILESGEKVCIFSKFQRMHPIITERIHKIDKEVKIAYVSGALSDKQRDVEVYEKFRDNDDYKVLLMTDAGAEGLNLSKCKYLIEYDLAESYGIQTQRHGRVERSDSIHETVFVYQLIANESWDEIQQKIVEKKEGYDYELIKSLVMEKE